MRNAFPHETGFSDTNVKYMKRWYAFYTQCSELGQQSDDQLAQLIGHQVGDQLEMPEKFALVPWRHHIDIIVKCQSIQEAVFYINKTIEGNWSRRMLNDYMESGLYSRQGNAITNFSDMLPSPQGDLTQEILKDPYNFDFLTMRKGYDEKELEDALVNNITRFLLELGQGFAYVGRQMELRMDDGTSFFPDLVFYHIRRKCYVIIDLKVVEFKPEFAGKINFYVTAADKLLRGEGFRIKLSQ